MIQLALQASSSVISKGFILEQSAPQLGAVAIVFMMCISGAFGGILDVLQIIEVRKLIEQQGPSIVSKKRFLGALLLGALGGIGGAFAMLFLSVITSKLKTDGTAENKLLLCSLGMVSGFLGYRVLRTVARRVEKQIQEVEERTDLKIQEAESKFKKYSELVDAVNIGRTVEADENAPNFIIEEAIERLERLRLQAPDNRELIIVLGNVYAKLNRVDKTMEVLTDGLRILRGLGPMREKDVADILYNRACYHLRMSEIATEEDDREELKTKAIADLEISVRLSPANKGDAAEDPDFQGLRNDERFRKLTTV